LAPVSVSVFPAEFCVSAIVPTSPYSLLDHTNRSSDGRARIRFGLGALRLDARRLTEVAPIPITLPAAEKTAPVREPFWIVSPSSGLTFANN
jgi:hypothetical protein